MIASALILSWIPFLYWPFQWLQTYYHEISHGLAALISTGQITRIELNLNGSGICYTRGGSRFLILVSGYLGAVFWGVLIYTSTAIKSARAYRGLFMLTGALVVATLVLWARDGATIGILLILLGLLYLQWRLRAVGIARHFFQFIGVYILLDAIKTPLVLIDGRHRGDGAALENLTGIPELIWIIGWFLTALIGLYIVWRASSKPL